MPAPTRVGYTQYRHTFAAAGAQSFNIPIPAGTQAGDQMIVYIGYQGGLPSSIAQGAPDWPAGWQYMKYVNHGTRGYALWYAGVYTSGANLTVTFNALAAGTLAASLMTVRGAAGFLNWNIGTWWDRNGLGAGAMNFTTRALGVAAQDSSMVLSFHGEASNTTEVSATSITGATKWFESAAQAAPGTDIDRHYIAYRDVTTAETTPNVDVTWPNSSQNGAAMQVAIPGADPAYPTISNASSFRYANIGNAVVDISAIPNGAWMIVSAMSSSTSAVITPPTGWTALRPLETTGTRRNFIFGKIKQSADGSSANFAQSVASTTGYGLVWGLNGSSIDNWIIGVSKVRSDTADPVGSRFTNIAPSATSTAANSLALVFSHEATTAWTTPYEVTNTTEGWSRRLWLQQVAASDRIETIWVGSKSLKAAGATGDAAITYVSSQDFNGWAMQVIIPNPNTGTPIPMPYVVSSDETFKIGSDPTLVFNKPTGLQDGDLLVAVLRSQSSVATSDWTASGSAWTRVGPTWPGATQTRLNAQFVRHISNAATEPSTYTFSRISTEYIRQIGQLIVVRSNTGTPVVDKWNNVYAGEDPVGSIDRAPDVYNITTPALEILWSGAEFSSPNGHAITSYPLDFTNIRYSTTSSDTGISRTVLYTGYHAYNTGTTTIQAGIDWTDPQVGAAAGSMTIKIGDAPDQSGSGYSLRNGINQEVKVFHTISGGVRTPQNVLPVVKGFDTVSDMLATPGFTWAHRGGSISWREMSLHGYTQCVVRGYGVLEVSLARTSDGVWFGLHDQTTDRTSGGTYGNASSQTWAQIQAQQIVVGGSGPNRPYMRWEEIVAAYGSTHILVVDPKHTWAFQTEFLNMVENDIGPERAIIKYSGPGSGSAALSLAAQARGFETWGFFYATDASSAQGGNGALQTWGPSWTLIGMDYTASQAIWDEALALGKPVIGHITPNQAAYDTAIAKGAVGVQVSGVAIVAPVSWWNT